MTDRPTDPTVGVGAAAGAGMATGAGVAAGQGAAAGLDAPAGAGVADGQGLAAGAGVADEPGAAREGVGAGQGVTAGAGAAAGAAADGARRQLVLLVLGVGAVVLGSVVAGTDLLGRILEPPFPVGLLLAAAAALIGVVVLLRAVARVGAARADAQELIRAVRLVFVAVGCFAAAAGWLVGSALPIIVGLIIVGIDVIETTFLLMTTASRGTDPGTPRAPGA